MILATYILQWHGQRGLCAGGMGSKPGKMSEKSQIRRINFCSHLTTNRIAQSYRAWPGTYGSVVQVTAENVSQKVKIDLIP